MKMRLSIASGALLVAAAMFQTANAASVLTVGIPAGQFNSVASSQAQDEWCWAASIQMVLNWHGVAVKQKDIVNRIYGKTVNAAATEDAISRALSGTAYTRSGRQVAIHSQHFAGAPEANLLLREMKQHHPMLITVRTGEHELHAAVITAAEYGPGRHGPVVTSLILRDPNPTRHHPGGASLTITGRNLVRFLPRITGYWLVDVR